MHQEPYCVVLRNDLVQFFEGQMVHQQTREVSILRFRVVLFEVVLEILFNFPDGLGKNIKHGSFLLPFSRTHIKANYCRLFPAVVDINGPICSNKGGTNRKERKEVVLFWTTQAVWVPRIYPCIMQYCLLDESLFSYI